MGAATAAAVAAGATANGVSEFLSRGVSPGGAPRLEASRRALLVAAARLALGAIALAAAVSGDVSFGTGLTEAGIGAGLILFALVSPGGRRRPRRLQASRARSEAQPWWRDLAEAMFPSTYVVAALSGVSLAYNRDLAAVLAGVLLGMGLAALVAVAAAR